MRHSHLSTPRTLRDCTFAEWGAAIERSSRNAESAAGVVLATVIGIIGALALVWWWSV